MTDKVLLSFSFISVLSFEKKCVAMDEIIYGIFKTHLDLIIEVWFSIVGLNLNLYLPAWARNYNAYLKLR